MMKVVTAFLVGEFMLIASGILCAVLERQDESTQPPISQSAEDEAAVSSFRLRLERINLRLQLERRLLDRFFVPLDEWTALRGPDQETFSSNLPSHWYMLVIRTTPIGRGKDLSLAFRISTEDSLKVGETYVAQMLRKRPLLAEAMEHYLITALELDETIAKFNKDNPDKTMPFAWVTLVEGVAHLYRMPTTETRVEDLRKEDLIY